jgi:hypothetical protein
MGIVRGMGANGKEASEWWTRWTRSSLGSDNWESDRRCSEGTRKVDHVARLGTYPYVRFDSQLSQPTQY